MQDRVEFSDTRRIKDYKEILEGLHDCFGEDHWSTILCWCGIIDNSPEYLGKYWQLWRLSVKEKSVGICGLYSVKQNNTHELWLGWFGVLPQYRNMKIGAVAVEFMEHEARKVGAKKILSYVSDEAAIRFYVRNGFEDISSVEDYLVYHPELAPYLGEPIDRILVKILV